MLTVTLWFIMTMLGCDLYSSNIESIFCYIVEWFFFSTSPTYSFSIPRFVTASTKLLFKISATFWSSETISLFSTRVALDFILVYQLPEVLLHPRTFCYLSLQPHNLWFIGSGFGRWPIWQVPKWRKVMSYYVRFSLKLQDIILSSIYWLRKSLEWILKYGSILSGNRESWFSSFTDFDA